MEKKAINVPGVEALVRPQTAVGYQGGDTIQMNNRSVDVSGMEALARPRSRKEFFKVLGAAGIGAAVGSTLMTRGAVAQEGGAASDIEILNFLLPNEIFEAEVFYPAALEAGILSSEAEAVVSQLVETEVAHRDAIRAAIESLGGTPVEAPEFMVPEYVLASEQAFLEVALQQEIKDVGANLGLAPLIQSPDILAAAGAIAGAEGENVVAFKNLLGIVPPANEAFPAALTQDEVLAILAPFLGMGGMMDTGGQAPAYGTGKAF